MHVKEVLDGIGKDVIRAAFYGRHSTDKQDMNMQLDAAQRFCKKYGLPEIDEAHQYNDADTSATKIPMKGRSKLIQLIDDAKKDQFDVVIAYSDSRLARDPVEHAQIRLALQGIPVLLCDTETVYNSEKSDLLSQIIRDGASKFEVDQTSERTRDTFISKVRRGDRIGGRLPYGYREKNGKLIVPRSDHLREIEFVFKAYGQGKGFRFIAEILKWKKSDGTPNKERVKSILINPFYAGYVSMNKVKRRSRMSVQDLDDWHLAKNSGIVPVISYDEWLRCFELYTRKKAGELAPRYYKTSFLLAGLLYCSNCNQKLKGRNKTRKGSHGKTYGSRFYECDVRQGGCGMKIDALEIHHCVLRDVIQNTVARSKADWEFIRGELIKTLEREIDAIENERQELKDKIRVRTDLLDEAKERLKPLIEPSADEDDVKRGASILEEYRAIIRRQMKDDELVEQQLKKRREILDELYHSADLLKKIRIDTLNEVGLRQLMLMLVHKVWIKEDGSYKISARYPVPSSTETIQVY
jgi:site-specific DNA recombinase